MAGRGARPRKVIPNHEFIEVQENMRLLKLFPDALELRDHFMHLRVKADEGKTWINQEKKQSRRIPLPNGGWFQGEELVNNKRNGYGIYSDLNGNLYEGVWADDKKCGHFHCYYTNGERFEGQFENDKRNGEGVHYYPDGSQYSGEYMNDYRHGVGFYFSAAEFYTLQKMHFRKYNEGQLVEEYEVYTAYVEGPRVDLSNLILFRQQRSNERPVNGFGTIVELSGNKYEGDFINSKKHGKGKVTAPNGDVFVGEFVEDKRHGLGMFKTTAGQYYYQSWHHDDLEYENETDKHNFENYLWYDEGGFSSHN